MTASRTKTNSGSAEVGGQTDEVEQDEVFHVLQNSRRRGALRVLRTVDGVVDLRTLADRVASLENDVAAENLSEDERQRVYISLYQTHLTKLDDVGAVEYDQDAGTVERQETATRFDQYLETERGGITNWQFDRNLADLGRSIRDVGGTTTTLLGGVLLGASAGPPSLMLLVGAVLAFTAMLSGWLVEGVTSLAA